MAILGKRKASAEPAISEEDAAAIFRQHFESQFAPLPDAKESSSKKTKRKEEDDDDESNEDDEDENDIDEEDEEGEDEWGGISDEDSSEEEEEVSAIEVVDHSGKQPSKSATMSKRELKAFMSSRPPDQTSRKTEPTPSSTSSSTALPEDAPSLLAQDLELRRLLAESHLLAPALTASGNAVAPKSFAAGRTRQKATDMRVQALGSKLSIHKQEKMPMNMRKGIVAAAGAREAKRRREAKENGIILERETSKKKGRKDRARDLAVDRPGVGRLKGAELRLSDKDIKSIEGGRDAFGRRGRR
ncbi:pre-rRNA processing and 40S ribosomal subunit assembly [Fusarium torreyae]|uniref:Pre-rRNA processing and 40S ribosomal subunit assembly n=1 Tax=Fusarium torreyae TaxID=1237075 RepID=A0A9W8SB22_9HYPO|nr:pre-rRNA processing and 40S ribosomal subunit assembly [Fusarium torreyae]